MKSPEFRYLSRLFSALFIICLGSTSVLAAGDAVSETEIESLRLLEIMKNAGPPPLPPVSDYPETQSASAESRGLVLYDILTGSTTVRDASELDAAAEVGEMRVEPRAGKPIRNATNNEFVYPDESTPGAAEGADSPAGTSSCGPPSPLLSTHGFPWTTTYKLLIRYNSGGSDYYYVCSASSFSDFQLLTTGHCLYNHDPDDNPSTSDAAWADEIWAWAAQTDFVNPHMGEHFSDEDRPFSFAKSVYMRTYTGWIDSADFNHDVGFITLDRRDGDHTGWMGREADVTANSVNFNGYPTETPYVPSGEILQYPGFDSGNVTSYTTYRIDMCAYTYGGHSGGPVWRFDESIPARYVQGVNSTSDRVGSATASRLDAAKLTDMNTTISEDESVRAPVARPDLAENVFTTADDLKDLLANTVEQGGAFDVEYNVLNAGFADSGAITVDFYLSTNNIISNLDTLIGTVNLGSLEAWTFHNPITSLNANKEPGTYYVGWIMRSAVSEYGGDQVCNDEPCSNVVVIADETLTITPVSTYALQVNSTGASSVSISSSTGHGGTTNYSHSVPAGASVNLEAPPDWAGQVFSHWTGCTSTAATTCSLTMPAGSHTVTVHYIPTPPQCYSLARTHSGSGFDPSASPGNSSGCAAGTYLAGQLINVTASPATGWNVGNWSGTNNNGSTSVSNQVTMPANNHTVSVNYIPAPPQCYLLSRAHTGSGSDPSASPSNSSGCSSGNYHAGELINLTASPASGWQVSSWSGTNNDASTSVSNQVTMPASNHSVFANYTEVTQSCFVLSRTHSGSGSDPAASPPNSSGCVSGSYTAGELIGLSATPASGWSVSSWTGTSNNSSKSTNNQLVMPSGNYSVSVIYAQSQPRCYSLSRTHNGSGSDPSALPSNSSGCPNGGYLAGELISLSATPAAGWSVASWIGSNNDGSTSTTNQATMPANSHQVTVNYINAPDSTSPTVQITSPTSSPSYSTSNSIVNLGGTASDNVGVTQVTWSNDRGGSGIAGGTTNWSINNIALSTGVNNITVTARDAVGNTGNDAISVTHNSADAEISLQFTFCSESGTAAEARGFITFKQSLMANPFSGGLSIPGSEIVDLSVTVSGATSGNGTFTLNDFNSIAWDSNFATLDFGKELVGQPTNDLPWGSTPSEGEAGDFNLFNTTIGAPNGVWWFTLAADSGAADRMVIKSMVPGSPSNGTASCGNAPDSELKNLSTRADVGTGADTAIAGFIISSGVGSGIGGSTQKCVVIRGRGPSMNVNNVSLLMDPTLTLYSGQTIIAENDNWGDQANPGDKTIIEDLGLAPPDFREAAIYKCLPEGAFTAFLRGNNGGVGVGIVEVFDADDGSAIMENISTRARVGSGPLVTIGGFIIEGTSPRKILVRGRGPSVGVPAGVIRLNNPRLRLYQLLENNSNVLLEENDNWQQAANAAEIAASGQAPPDPNESAILLILDPGVYTGIVDGVFGATGTGIIEVIDLTEPGNPTGKDSDGDRLEDSVETNTGVFLNPGNTGTNPNNPDTDGDGINDGDEVLGTLGGLNLPGMGVSPVRKDLLMEYDWFDDSLDCAPHSHRPSPAAIAAASAPFNVSPVSNPGTATGVNVINDYGQGGLFNGGNRINDANGVIDGGVNDNEYKAHKNANFASNRNGYFHYVLLPHRYDTNSGSSGQAEFPGDDLIVSLNCAGSDHNVAHTIVHEVGHNFQLGHGGSHHCNYKPNYNSVMNYAYQFPGVDSNCTPPGDGTLNYSIGDRISLNENNLNENNGTCGPGFPWDWNGNFTTESSVAFDVNSADTFQSSNCGGTMTTLTDFNDWANLNFGGLSDADGALPVPQQIISEQPVPVEFR